MRYHIVCPILPTLLAPETCYRIQTKHCLEFAESIGQVLAEGAALLVTDNAYGPVELRPLVVSEE